jgi:DNA polymerase III alpha subunit (gram-positive type)
MQLKQIVQDLLNNSKEIKKIRKQMHKELRMIDEAHKKGYNMIFLKEKLESLQNYDWMYPDRIELELEPKLCPYCKNNKLDDLDEYACQQCKIDLKKLN